LIRDRYCLIGIFTGGARFEAACESCSYGWPKTAAQGRGHFRCGIHMIRTPVQEHLEVLRATIGSPQTHWRSMETTVAGVKRHLLGAARGWLAGGSRRNHHAHG